MVAMSVMDESKTAMATIAIESIESSVASGSIPCANSVRGSGTPSPPSENTVTTWMRIPTSHAQKAAAAARGNAIEGAPICSGTR